MPVETRQLISEDKNYIVYRSRVGNSESFIKIPAKNRGARALKLQRAAKEKIGKTQVKLATNVYIFRQGGLLSDRKSYLVRQRILEPDGSIGSIRGYLQERGNRAILEEYIRNPDNFVAREGTVYWINPLSTQKDGFMKTITNMTSTSIRLGVSGIKQASGFIGRKIYPNQT